MRGQWSWEKCQDDRKKGLIKIFLVTAIWKYLKLTFFPHQHWTFLYKTKNKWKPSLWRFLYKNYIFKVPPGPMNVKQLLPTPDSTPVLGSLWAHIDTHVTLPLRDMVTFPQRLTWWCPLFLQVTPPLFPQPPHPRPNHPPDFMSCIPEIHRSSF